MDALAVLGLFRPNLVILDLGLPTMDGYEVARRPHQTRGFEQVPILCVSGHGFPKHRQKALAAGCTLHLVKPVAANDLRAAITSLIG